MRYVSTRGGVADAGFEDVLLAGLAPDGGLYMPSVWPEFTRDDIAAFKGKPYAVAAAEILARFTGESFDEPALRAMAEEVYGAFDHSGVAPVRALGDDDFLLELFHGPTLAFKDFAMQMLGRLFDAALERRERELTIIAATSGDTGAAAIEALKDCSRVRVVVLHPLGRVTDVQRRMMTSVDRENICNIAVEGSFDDCQAIVKTLFADKGFCEAVSLSGVNSINWARLAAQIVYYFTAHAAVADPDEPVNFVVPTGNFGDIFAGYAAKRMGLPIGKLAVATNENDILHRALSKGDYTPAGVKPTSSPSMDIQVASNFERLLFEANQRDGDVMRNRMDAFSKDRAMTLSRAELDYIGADFVSYAASESDTAAEIEAHWEHHRELIDPHTAVGRAASNALREKGLLDSKVVTLSTAHPAKFPDAVTTATGQAPDLPARYSDLFEREEFMETAAPDAEAVKAVILRMTGETA